MDQHVPDSLPASVPAPGTYTLDPERTTVRVAVEALFGLMTVRGTFRLKAGEVTIATDPGASSVRASIDAGSSLALSGSNAQFVTSHASRGVVAGVVQLEAGAQAGSDPTSSLTVRATTSSRLYAPARNVSIARRSAADSGLMPDSRSTKSR